MLASSAGTFLILLIAAGATGSWVYRHATAPETATLSVVSGGGALVRSPGDSDWRLVDAETRLSERDQISTALGTVVWVTAFDGSTIEIAEDTVVTVNHLRSSRFLNRTKLIDVTLERGAVYIGMAPRGDFSYSEFIVRAGDTRVTMSDARNRVGAGSFLVEVMPAVDGASERAAVRAAVLRGDAIIAGPGGETTLTAPWQLIVDAAGVHGDLASAVRELIVNGSFDQGLAGWVEFTTRGPLAPEALPIAASIELVQEQTPRGSKVAVELLRPSDALNTATAGIRQRIGKSIRLQSSLVLDFDVKISDQQPPSSGADLTQFPLTFEINYVDAAGQENRWTHSYYILSEPAVSIPRDRATRLERDTWQRVVFDLRNLSPLPRQVTSIVVYASGESYQTRVANISLTSAELVDQE
ncbi:MAG TPA: hypothetical protein VMM78_13500 [Thermomicrobiales bacterium]|nr:hypothetical protein [Thermomicrobiales bacterium]